VLTQSSTVIMTRRPMIIFNETVVPGTVLLQIPFLKSTPLSPFLRTIANQANAAFEMVRTTGRVFERNGLAILNFRSALDWGRAICLICRSELRRE
jgi:hypothetical protein